MKSFENLLNPIKVKELARFWINEDIPSFDIQGFVIGDKPVKANIFCKEPGVLAGVPFVNAICEEIGLLKPEWIVDEGIFLRDASSTNKIVVATVSGPSNKVLFGERTILNTLARCSGVATQCFHLKSVLDNLGWKGELVGTRKTTPGYRLIEKYGLIVGGAGTHRYDMSSMVMLKDNHVKLSNIGGSMADIIRNAKKYSGFHCKIEVECQNLDEAMVSASAGADIVMLDNFDSAQASRTSIELKRLHPNLLIEASGGINSENITQYAIDSIDIISMSTLVQGYPIVDYSMKIDLA